MSRERSGGNDPNFLTGPWGLNFDNASWFCSAPTNSNDVSESAGSLTHNLTLSAPSSQTVTVTVRGINSTSAGFAGSADLGVADQIITFAPGQTTASFTTPILEDSLYEGNESYQFTIISATGAEIDLTNTNARYLTGNILDNDQPTNPSSWFCCAHQRQ